MTMLVFSVWLGLSSLLNQSPSALVGVWAREAASRPALDDVAPAWEKITVDATQVTIRRASRPRVIEVYPFDGVERSTVPGSPESGVSRRVGGRDADSRLPRG